jgi:hypothetical protein
MINSGFCSGGRKSAAAIAFAGLRAWYTRRAAHVHDEPTDVGKC